MNNFIGVQNMFKQTLIIIVLALAIILPACQTTKVGQVETPGESLIIYYDPEAGKEALLNAVKKFDSEVLYVYKVINGIAVTVPKDRTVSEAIKYYERVPGVLSVNKDQKLQLN
mgnify:CR=1 FL=1